MEKIYSYIKTYLHLGEANQNFKFRKSQDNEEGGSVMKSDQQRQVLA